MYIPPPSHTHTIYYSLTSYLSRTSEIFLYRDVGLNFIFFSHLILFNYCPPLPFFRCAVIKKPPPILPFQKGVLKVVFSGSCVPRLPGWRVAWAAGGHPGRRVEWR